MSLADELVKLEQLRDRGTLTAEEFARAKLRLLEVPLAAVPGVAAVNRFRRSRSDRWLGGICGGLALSTGLESWIWRLVFTLMIFLGGSGLLFYVLLWIFVPEE